MLDFKKSVEGLWFFDGSSIQTELENDRVNKAIDIKSIAQTFMHQGLGHFTLEIDEQSFVSLFQDENEGNVVIVNGPISDYAAIHHTFSNRNEFVFDKPKLFKAESSIINVDPNSIQASFLPALKHFEGHFQDAQILFRPLQKMGGDFYWINASDRYSLVVLGDCVGHGIDGALVSMLVLSVLKQQFSEINKETLLDSIYKVYETLNSLLEKDNPLGLDTEMGFLLKDMTTGEIFFSGTGISLIHSSAHSLQRYRTKFNAVEKNKLTLKSIEYNADDKVMMYSDGITDVLHSSEEEKLGTKGLLRFTEEQPLTVNDLNGFLESYRGDAPLTDDMTAIILTL